MFYTDQDTTINRSWSNFTYFAQCRGYLIIAMEETIESAYFFSSFELGDEGFTRLRNMLAEKLPEKKLKF